MVESQPASLDTKEVWYSNMHLLGFQPSLCDEKYKVRFEKDMFVHINMKGSEVILHFLFSKLDSHLSYEEFRDCWPVYDKKQEQLFRKTCSNWLAKISKEEPQSKLPRMSASLLLSPGGDKFYLFLLRFSSYVLKSICLNEATSLEKSLFLSNFIASNGGFGAIQPTHKEVSYFAMQSHLIRHSNGITARAQLAAGLHKEWEEYANQLSAEYRKLSTESRNITKKLLSLEEQQKQRALINTPQSKSASVAQDKMLALSAEIMDRQRNSRIIKAREMWKTLEKFIQTSAGQVEVVDSIVQGKANDYTVNAKDITFQIPKMICDEYDSMNRAGKVSNSNTYQAGRLNLTCLIQMWVCSLHILRRQMIKGDLPTFSKELEYINGELHSHRAYLYTATNLRASLSGLKASLEKRIQDLESQLNDQRDTPLPLVGGVNPGHMQLLVPEITLPSLGMGLLPPSPEKTATAGTPEPRGGEDRFSDFSLLASNDSTPNAVRNISLSVQQASHLKNHYVHSQKPSSRIPTIASHSTRMAKADRSALDPRLSSSVSSPLHLREVSAADPPNRSGSADALFSLKEGSGGVTTPTQPRKGTRNTHPDLKKSRNVMPTPPNPNRDIFTPPNLMESRRDKGCSNKSTPHSDVVELKNMPRAHEILADQIAAAVSALSDSGDSSSVRSNSPSQLHSVVDTVSAMGKDAFSSRDLIQRTPLSKRNQPKTSQINGVSKRNLAVYGGSDISLTLSTEDEPTVPQNNRSSNLQATYLVSNSRDKRSSLLPSMRESSKPNHDEEEEEEEEEEKGEEEKEKQASLLGSYTPNFDTSHSRSSYHQDPSHAEEASFSMQSPAPSDPRHTVLPSPYKTTDEFRTPHQFSSLLNDIDPPTPFQHAEFDLDSSVEGSGDKEGEGGSGPSLIDLTTPGKRSDSPLMASTAYYQRCQHPDSETSSLPGYLYPSTGGDSSKTADTQHSSHNPWLAGMNKSDEAGMLSGGSGSPDLVSTGSDVQLSPSS